MKTTTVPAQVTTVEDRLAGNLSLSQLLLLVCPVFVSCAIYVVFPPFLKISIVKVTMSVSLFIFFGIMAIRIKGKIVFQWLVLVLRYRNRPRYYLYNKNDSIFRQQVVDSAKSTKPVQSPEIKKPNILPLIDLATPEIARLETAIADPRSNFNFRQNRKGVLSVHITEIQ